MMTGDNVQAIPQSRNRLAMAAALMAIFTTIFASNLPTPLYAVWQVQWGFSSMALTAIFSVYVFGVASTLLTLGSLSDKLGRRQVLVPGMLLTIISAGMFMLAEDIFDLGFARVLTGIGTGIITGAASAAVVEMEPDGNWARGATLSALFFTLGAFAGPTVSSLALRWDIDAGLWPFVVIIALSMTTITLLLIAPWPAHLGQRRSDFSWRTWRPTRIKMPREMLGVFAFAGAAISLAWSTGSLYGSLGPSLATNLVGIGDRSTAGLFAAAWQLLAGMSQFACQRQPVSRMLLLGPSTLMVGLLAMAAAVLFSSPWIFAFATIATAFGAGATGVVAIASVSEVAPPAERGGITSAFYLLAYLTMATVVLSLGFVSDLIGLGNSILGFTVVVSVAAFGLIVVAVRSGRVTAFN